MGSQTATQQQLSFGAIDGILQGRRDQLQGTVWSPQPPIVTFVPDNGTTSGGANTGGRQNNIQPPTQVLTLPGPGELPVDPGPPASSGSPPGQGTGRTLSERRFSGAPPIGETRFVANEVLLQVADSVSPDRVGQVAQQLGLTLISSQNLASSGRTLYRFSFAAGGDIRAIIPALEHKLIIASVQPNFLFTLTRDMPIGAAPKLKLAQSGPANAAPGASLPAGDPAQYTIEKLHLEAVHKLAIGRNVPIAVVDSEVDGRNPDLQGAIKATFDTTATPSSPQSHGTGMAGAIVARSQLLGVAPGANIVAIKAFIEGPAGVNGTSEQILKGIDHAVSQGARVINMSFAGPRDSMLERLLAAAYDKNIVLVAAAGNAGPKSPPLFPGADPHVIAVTATDESDKPFAMANRGKYIALAAPGVDVLVPAVNEGFQLSTGTSVATANVSGVVALLLEHFPTLTPAQVRSALTRTARKILANDKDFQTGAGLVDPLQAFAYLSSTASLGELGPALAYGPATLNRNPQAVPYYKAVPAVLTPPPWAAWVQGLGDWERRGALNSNDLPRTQTTYGVQTGFDHLWQGVVAPGDYFIAGVVGSFASSRAAFTNLPFGIRLEGPGVGAYAMWISGGLSADLKARTDFFNLAEDLGGTAPNISLRVTAPGVSQNIQYKFWLGGPTFFEPTMGYMLTRTLFDASGATFGFQDATTLRVQAGARAGMVFDINGVHLVPTLTALVYDNAIQQGTALPTGLALPLVPTDQGQVRGEVIPQVDFYFNNGYAAFLQAGMRFGRELVGGTAKVGLMKQW